MICHTCQAAGRKPKGTPLAGYCDTCGWALRDNGTRFEASPAAAMAVATAEVLDEENRGVTHGLTRYEPGGYIATDAGQREILRRAFDFVTPTVKEPSK